LGELKKEAQMKAIIHFREVPIDEVKYDPETGLFPYSSRLALDKTLISRLKNSIAQTGMWQPIVLKADTMEGVAGNHRFHAFRELQQEREDNLEAPQPIPAALLQCDEGMACAIGLIENDLREGLTPWEQIRSILQAAGQTPQVTREVLNVDEETAEQLKLWLDDPAFFTSSPDGVGALKYLTRDWIALVNRRLGDHDDLRRRFMNRLRDPMWVHSNTIQSLSDEISMYLADFGARFCSGKTWHPTPPRECLRSFDNVEDLVEEIGRSHCGLSSASHGHVGGTCPYLMLISRFARQIETIDFQEDSLLESVSMYCIDPNVHKGNSCFHTLERELARRIVDQHRDEGIMAVQERILTESEGMGEFTWRKPLRAGTLCTPENCLHRGDDQPGYLGVVRPGQELEMVCIHAKCGQEWKDKNKEKAEEERAEARQMRLEALNRLCELSARRVLSPPPGQGMDITDRALLETLEAILVPDWDTEIRSLAVSGIHALLADGQASRHSKSLPEPEILSRLNKLVNSPLGSESSKLGSVYEQIRDLFCELDWLYQRWVSYLTVIRSWKESVGSVTEIESITKQLVGYTQ
jgi:hypothetical protein